MNYGDSSEKDGGVLLGLKLVIDKDGNPLYLEITDVVTEFKGKTPEETKVYPVVSGSEKQ